MVIDLHDRDPAASFALDWLQRIQGAPCPTGFERFWRERYRRASAVDPRPELLPSRVIRGSHEIFDVRYQSTDGRVISGWFVRPKDRPIKRGLVVGHGYGGRDAPDFRLMMDDTAVLFPCCRGLGRSCSPDIPVDPQDHVIQGIECVDSYVIGGCVDDLWCGVSALERLCPGIAGRVGYLGISFGGGLGALAIPWDRRIARAHLNVPTFGHVGLRMECPTFGSSRSLQTHYQQHPETLDVLEFFDASVAAGFIAVPMHVAVALSDPFVAPPGQFSIFNSIRSDKRLFLLQRGHQPSAEADDTDARLFVDVKAFFNAL